MRILESIAYHYFEAPSGVFANLSEMPFEKAIRLDFKRYDSLEAKVRHLRKRYAYEQLMHSKFVAKGGKPKRRCPYYFCVGRDDRIAYLYKEPRYIAMRVCDFAPSVVSFTYGDSFYTFERSDKHPSTAQVYTVNDVEHVVREFGLPHANGYWPWPHVLEMQVWDNVDILEHLCAHPTIHDDIDRDRELREHICELSVTYDAYLRLPEVSLSFNPFGGERIRRARRIMILALFLLDMLGLKSQRNVSAVLTTAAFYHILEAEASIDGTGTFPAGSRLLELGPFGGLPSPASRDVQFLLERWSLTPDSCVRSMAGPTRDERRLSTLLKVLVDCETVALAQLDGGCGSRILNFRDSRKLGLIADLLVREDYPSFVL